VKQNNIAAMDKAFFSQGAPREAWGIPSTF